MTSTEEKYIANDMFFDQLDLYSDMIYSGRLGDGEVRSGMMAMIQKIQDNLQMCTSKVSDAYENVKCLLSTIDYCTELLTEKKKGNSQEKFSLTSLEKVTKVHNDRTTASEGLCL